MWISDRRWLRTLSVTLCTFSIAAAVEPGQQQTDAATTLAQQALYKRLMGSETDCDHLLATALKIDKNCRLAHWSTASLRHHETWSSLDEVEVYQAQDETWAEYRHLRAAVQNGLRGEITLAGWCRQNQFHDAAQLHYARVLRDPNSTANDRKTAAKNLGLQKCAGRWLTAQQAREYRRDAQENASNSKRWERTILNWREAIEDGPGRRQRFALGELRKLTDATAILELDRLMGYRSESLATETVRVLMRIMESKSTTALARHAVNSPWSEVRALAIDGLQSREIHDYVPYLLDSIVAPVQSRFHVSIGADGLVRHEHHLLREGNTASHAVSAGFVGGPRFVPVNRITVNGARSPGPAGEEARELLLELQVRALERLRDAMFLRQALARRQFQQATTIQQQLVAFNTLANRHNENVFTALEQTTEQRLQRTPVAWQSWWDDYNEVYRGERPIHRYRLSYADPYYVPYSVINVQSCFPAGTKVRTHTGLVNIEDIQVGDRVLAQNVDTGQLRYQLVVKTTKRPPAELLKIQLDDVELVATKGHPVWVNGIGWRMAKELVVGDTLHAIDQTRQVKAIVPATKAAAYNLVVDEDNNYFVTAANILVHDNTYRRSTTSLTPGLTPDIVSTLREGTPKAKQYP